MVLLVLGQILYAKGTSSQSLTKQSLKNFPPRFKTAFETLLDSNSCTASQIRLYSNPSKNIQLLSFVPHCTKEGFHLMNGNYPQLFWLHQNDILPVNLWEYGFMYESGQIQKITDLNHDQMPELWLAGCTCECEGETEDSECARACTDTMVVELTPNLSDSSPAAQGIRWEEEPSDGKWVKTRIWDQRKWHKSN